MAMWLSNVSNSVYKQCQHDVRPEDKLSFQLGIFYTRFPQLIFIPLKFFSKETTSQRIKEFLEAFL